MIDSQISLTVQKDFGKSLTATVEGSNENR